MSKDVPEIAVTGSGWMGRGVGSIWTLVRNVFSGVNNEIQIAAYTISESDGEFFELLDDALARKTRVMLIVNRFFDQDPNVRDRLVALSKKHSNFILKNFEPDDSREDLHAKLIVIDHSVALVGSANLTWKGMVMNHEIMVRLTGESAQTVGKLIDRLSKYSYCKPVDGKR